MKKKLLDQYDFYSQMKRELELQYRLGVHPNIVKMYGCFYDDNYVYAVLEYLPEGNLYQRLKKVKIFTDEDTRNIIQQIVSALWHCQLRNVIHRDIKPENILVKSGPGILHVKLCDFGWSTHSINQNRTTFCGTPDYLAPELVTHKPYDDKIDNWAVGILTYELLTGASPFAPNYGSQNQNDIYTNIQNIDLCYNKNYEEIVSDEAKDFIS